MKTLYTIYAIVLLIHTSYSQNPGEIDFATQIEASGEMNNYGLNISNHFSCVDNDGFLYYGGNFNDSIIFGSSTFHCTNEMDGYFCKTDTNNSFLWAVHIKCSERMYLGSYYDSNEDIIFLYGSFYGNLFLGDDTLSSLGWSDMFIAKLDTDGSFIQTMQTGGFESDNITCMTKDIEGDIIIGGYYYKSTIIGDTVFNGPSGSGKETFTAKLSYGLDFIWVINGTGPDTDEVRKCITDNESNIYIVGKSYQGITFDTIVLDEPYKNVFISKINKDGEYIWAKQYGGDNEDCWVFADGIIVGDNSNYYIAGTFREKIIIEDNVLLCDGFYDIYLLSFDTEGNFIWAKRYGGNGEDVTGTLINDEGNIYYSGMFQGEIELGNTTLSGTGLLDAFISELDENGNFKWAYHIGGTDIYSSRVFCNSLYKSGPHLYLGGVFETDIVIGDYSFESHTSFNGYVARFKMLATGIKPNHLANNTVSVFPNPANREITVQYYMPKAGNAIMYLTNNNGTVLKSFNNTWHPSGQHRYKLYVQEYPAGVYFIKIVSAAGTINKKIILSK